MLHAAPVPFSGSKLSGKGGGISSRISDRTKFTSSGRNGDKSKDICEQARSKVLLLGADLRIFV